MRTGAVILLVILLVNLPCETVSADAVEQVGQATSEMNAWLGEGKKADAWRRFLRIDRLNEQLERRDEADAAQLVAILSRFRGRAKGIENPKFVAVRDALEAWVDELGVAPHQMLAEWMPRADSEFTPIRDDQIAAARDRAVDASEKLAAFLAKGSAENAESWKAFLLWDELKAQLADGATPDPEVLSRVYGKYVSGHEGLEWSEFVHLRESLRRYLRLLNAKADPDPKARFDRVMQQINDRLSGDTFDSRVSALLDRLNDLGQANQLVRRVQDVFGSPNLYFSASVETVVKGLSNPVDETATVDELILGTRVRGTAHTVGQVGASLVPREDRASLEITMTGDAHTNTVGRQRPVSIYSRGVTQVAGRKRLVIDESGISGEPATANCTTRTTISGIRTDNRLGSNIVQHIAWNRVYQQKSQAEFISARRAERRVARMIDNRADKMIRDGNDQIERDLRGPLRRRNMYPRWVRFWSTRDRLFMRSLQARRTQLAAAGRPPSVPVHNVMIQVHESLVLNSAANGFGGFLLTDERAQDLAKELTGEVPPELEIRQDEDPWSITFDSLQPLSVRLNEDQVVIAIRGQRFTRADEVLRQTVEIAATYTIAAESGRVKMVRQGDIRVSYPNKEGERLSLLELRNKTFMTRKFSGLFKEEILGEGLDLPDRFENLEDLALEFVSATNGWLSLGWN